MVNNQTPPPHDLAAIANSRDGLLGMLLGSLSAEVRDELLSRASLRELAPRTIIIEDGEVSGEIGYVIEGTLAMVRNIDHSRTHIVGLLMSTDIYGRLFDGPSSYRIETLSPATVLSFPRAPFEQVLRRNPKTERLFLVHLLDEVDAAREWLGLISGRTVINRAASFLTILLRRSKSAGPAHKITLRLPLARKDLAHYLGTRTESLSRAFHKLEDTGIVRIIDPYCFEILDQEALEDISGDNLTITD